MTVQIDRSEGAPPEGAPPEAAARDAAARDAGARADGQSLTRRPEIGLEALPAIARVAAAAWLKAATWSVETSLHVSSRLARAASDPDAAAQLLEEVSSGLRSYAREFLGIADLDDRVKRLGPGPGGRTRLAGRRDHVLQAQGLQDRGRELLRQAADVSFEEDAHPAYARILGEMVPDEGRILRLLARDGAQPTVDVRASNLIGVGSQLIAPGLNMIGAQAGLRHRDRVAAYLGNLFRLGLVAFSEEPVEDPILYQVLEAQPEVMAAIKATTRAKSVQRSVRLTPFGQDFCRVCLPLDDADPLPALPPGQDTGNGQPPR